MANTRIWWSNATFFVLVHLLTFLGVYYKPWNAMPRATLVSWFFVWQAGSFGITIGYHRLWSHRSFRATLPVRIMLAAMGSSAFQGSIKWWCLRHRLHHRFTDDAEHDPYAATKGLLHAHMGWIFFKPTYPRMKLIESDDLVRDPVVRFQHKYYVPIALLFGFAIPCLLGRLGGDTLGGFIWGSLASKLAIWHCTFLVNSLAHWHGLQPYSDENTSRGNLVLALLTSGEGNHNFHAFPHDFRSGPGLTEWDPSKWIILCLHFCGLAHGLRTAREKDMEAAIRHMQQTRIQLNEVEEDTWKGVVWEKGELEEFIRCNPGTCLVQIGAFVVDVTSYLGEHPGGARILRQYSINQSLTREDSEFSATFAFEGGLSKHSMAAKWRMRELRIAEIRGGTDKR